MSETKQYQWNETVDIAIRGARVDHHADGELWVQLPGAKAGSLVPLTDAVSVTVTQPADGPAQPGDIWRTPEGVRWFTYEEMQYGHIALRLTSGELRNWTLAEICESFGTPVLEYRAPAPSGPEACDCLAPLVPEPAAPPALIDALSAASQELRKTTNGEEFAQAFGGFMGALGKAAEHEQGFHDDCDPARCADAEARVTELLDEHNANAAAVTE